MGKWGGGNICGRVFGEDFGGVLGEDVLGEGLVRKYCHLFIDGLSRLPRPPRIVKSFLQNIYTTLHMYTNNNLEIYPPQRPQPTIT